MKTKNAINFISIALLLVFANGMSYTYSQNLSCMSFNLRYDNSGDGANIWEYRKEAVAKMLNYYSPDFIGTQEGLSTQVSYLKRMLKNYALVGVGREDGKDKGEYCAIYYDSTRFAMINNATFWLSDTPEKVSTGWDAALPRICTFALFKNKTSGKQIWVFNTHFDHMGSMARKKSAELIIEKVRKINQGNLPIILMGDFNTGKVSEPIDVISSVMSEASEISEKPAYGPSGTFNGFNSEIVVVNCIDFVFVSKLKVSSVRHIDDRREDGKFLSDHFPVFVGLKL